MAITQNQVDFALELLRKQYANSSESLVFSPVSISIGLAMCYGGAKGETKKQIGRILAGDGAVNEEDIHKHFSTIVKAVNTSGLDLQLDVANKMFADKDLPLVEEYAKKLESSYGCGIGHVDFSEHDNTAKEINQYVEDNTHEKIREIITPDVLKACQGAFVLINAIYFKAGWTKTFTESGTVKEPFHIAQNQTKEVDMMHENFGKMPYYENDQVQVLKLPYLASVHGQAPAKCNLAMYVYLPKERFGLEKFLAGVNGKELTDIAGQMEEYFVKAALPRFKVESSFALKDVLSQMGMPEAFSDSADLSGIAKQPMRLAEVFHKTFIETNEKGTEAAAVTALFAEMRSMPAGNAEFIADHPFFYTICNREHDLLFCGVIRSF